MLLKYWFKCAGEIGKMDIKLARLISPKRHSFNQWTLKKLCSFFYLYFFFILFFFTVKDQITHGETKRGWYASTMYPERLDIYRSKINCFIDPAESSQWLDFAGYQANLYTAFNWLVANLGYSRNHHHHHLFAFMWTTNFKNIQQVVRQGDLRKPPGL